MNNINPFVVVDLPSKTAVNPFVVIMNNVKEHESPWHPFVVIMNNIKDSEH